MLLLIVGTGAGVYLVQRQQKIKSKATLERTRIEVVGDNVVSGKAVSRNVKLALTYVAPSPSLSPTPSPTPSPSPSPDVSLGNVNIQGAVAIDGTDDAGANRFTAATCPGQPFQQVPSIKVNNPTLGDANWDCGPGYYFGVSNQAKVNLSGPQTFTITPPAGYRCEGVSNPSYINRDGVLFSGCSTTVNIQSSTNTVFIWFKLVPTSVQGISTSVHAQEANFFPTHFRVSNDGNTLTSAPEQPFAGNPTQIDWVLTEGNGQKTVYAQFKVNGFWGPIYETSISLEVVTASPTPTPVPTPAPTPTPAPIRVSIKGAVTIDRTNPVTETRLTAASCTDKAYISSPALKVRNTALGEAKWDCTAEYYFGENKTATLNLSGRQEFTITPPTGYRCDGVGVYINGSPESLASGCSATVDLSQNTRELYIWFYLAANPLGQNCQNLTNKLNNGLGTSCSRKQVGLKAYDKVADINDDKSINAADRAALTNNRYDEAWCAQKLAKTTDPCPPPLVVSCSAAPAATGMNREVTWSAQASGGDGNLSYLWSGSDSLAAKTISPVSLTYTTAGSKTGKVKVSSQGEVKEVDCTNTVTIYEQGDTNWDGAINLLDLTYFFSKFNSTSEYKGANLDSSGQVDNEDLLLLKEIPAVKAVIEAI